ncbi:hypothetical protein O1Q96_27860 [Streptomyces sp. Qhu-G9]|uniref:hypothetical protein n=1 Tax=Streptomyces sp. Qhu-G9 TaxID=3452799 RepID=UPI0022AC5B36|nr:hypothetical protein [Streptomyces aurantiacus]WAU83166.1 hypothetical protein O1Q96_27860 [Streptomyces aurantiacus]
MSEQRPLRPPTPAEELERFHNGDTLDNIPIITERRSPPWKRVLAGAMGVAVLAGALAFVLGRPQHSQPGVTASERPGALPTAAHAETTASPPHSEPSAPWSSDPPAPTTPPDGQTQQSCVDVTYKLPTGDALCESRTAVCALGSPMYTENLDTICGTAPLARVYVANTDKLESGGCLSLQSSTWVTGTAEYVGTQAPMYQCSAVVDRTALEAGGPLTVCQEPYPHTRQTFLAEVTTPAGSTGACLTTNHGA